MTKTVYFAISQRDMAICKTSECVGLVKDLLPTGHLIGVLEVITDDSATPTYYIVLRDNECGITSYATKSENVFSQINDIVEDMEDVPYDDYTIGFCMAKNKSGKSWIKVVVK